MLLNCLATRRAKIELLCKKRLDMNGAVAYGTVIDFQKKAKVQNLSRHFDRSSVNGRIKQMSCNSEVVLKSQRSSPALPTGERLAEPRTENGWNLEIKSKFRTFFAGYNPCFHTDGKCRRHMR